MQSRDFFQHWSGNGKQAHVIRSTYTSTRPIKIADIISRHYWTSLWRLSHTVSKSQLNFKLHQSSVAGFYRFVLFENLHAFSPSLRYFLSVNSDELINWLTNEHHYHFRRRNVKHPFLKTNLETDLSCIRRGNLQRLISRCCFGNKRNTTKKECGAIQPVECRIPL